MGGQLDEYPMRPETLNPLFTDTESLDGVGPKLRKPLEKLGLTRVSPSLSSGFFSFGPTPSRLSVSANRGLSRSGRIAAV